MKSISNFARQALRQPFAVLIVISMSALPVLVSPIGAQTVAPDNLQMGIAVPPDVEEITGKALKYLVNSQNLNGTWDGGFDSHAQGRQNSGVCGLALMAMMSTGEDPNTGPYSTAIRAALRYIITTQNPQTGFLPNTMYNHGFCMLALAEAYGTVDDSLLWVNAKGVEPERKRTIGKALTMAVELALKSQNQNSNSAWRYVPTSADADTSVSGAVLVGLLAARNAGVAIPDANIEKAIAYFVQLTGKKSGTTMYTQQRMSLSRAGNLTAVAALVMSISQNRDLEVFQSLSKKTTRYVEIRDTSFPYYNMYYMAQALFQTNYNQWVQWNKITTRQLRRQQNEDGSFTSQHGKAYASSMACLALALNYRFLPIYER